MCPMSTFKRRLPSEENFFPSHILKKFMRRVWKNKLSRQIESAEKNVFLTFDWQLRDCPTSLIDKKKKKSQLWGDVKIQPRQPPSPPLPSTPPPWPGDPPRVFLKDDSLLTNTWALNVGSGPREGEKQTQQVSAFLSMKNKHRERDEREGRRRICGDTDTEVRMRGCSASSDSSLPAHRLRQEPVLLAFDTGPARLPLK